MNRPPNSALSPNSSQRPLRTLALLLLAIIPQTSCEKSSTGSDPATALSITTQPPATAQSGVTFGSQPVVQLRDANGSNVGQSNVSVTATIASGGGTLSGTTTVQTNTSGQAVFTNLGISGIIGARTLQFNATGLTSTTSNAITLTAGPPSQLALTTQPASSAQSGVVFAPQPVVQLRDASGNDVGQAGVTVTASIASGGGTLGGNNAVQTNGSGQAIFTDLSIFGVIGSRTLQFNATGLTAATSNGITLTAGPPSQLVLTTQPATTAQSGVTLAPQPVVQLRDPSGNNVSQSGVSVTASIASGGGTLRGTVTLPTNGNGQAVFTDLNITGSTGGRTLQFNATALAGTISNGITLTAGPPSQLVITTQPAASAQSGVVLSPQPVVQLQDSSGNAVSQSAVSVTASIASGTGALSGTSTVQTSGSGQAVYLDLSITGSGSHTLRFTAAGLTPDTSTSISVSIVATQLVVTTQPADTARSAVTLARQPVVRLRDGGGNDISQSGVSVTASIASGSGTLGGTKIVQTNGSGQAIYTDLAITGQGVHTIRFDATGLSAGTSSGVTLPTALQDNVPVAALSGGPGSTRWYVLQVPGGATNLSVTTTGGTGDADLYVRYNALPDTFPGNFDCNSITNTTTETCNLPNPNAGSWFIMVFGYDVYSGVTLNATYTTTCSLASPGDADGDRLPDCVETNTGTFVSTLNTGTDPNKADTDGDGLRDGDEVLGTLLGLDLPGMGVSPLRRDILLEYDWFDEALECAAHSHRPTPTALALVATAFANAPVVNPDGSTGIHLVQDYGQGGAFTGGNLIGDADGVLIGGVNDAEFKNHKLNNFASNRMGYFHYVILPHRYDTNSSSSGQAELPGNDLIVSLFCANSDGNVAHTIMHELGHNLGLGHGGLDGLNYKPNYNSVMNYKYQFPGVDNNCTPPGDGVLDYSRGLHISLNENNLDETQGICGQPPGPGWDWNGDADALDVGIAFDINVDGLGAGDGFFSTLQDYNDWTSMTLSTGLSDFDGAPLISKVIVTCTNSPPDVRR